MSVRVLPSQGKHMQTKGVRSRLSQPTRIDHDIAEGISSSKLKQLSNPPQASCGTLAISMSLTGNNAVCRLCHEEELCDVPVVGKDAMLYVVPVLVEHMQ